MEVKQAGFVLVCESFEFPHDYAIMAFAENAEDLEKIKPDDSPENFNEDECSLINGRTYYIHPISGLDLPPPIKKYY